MKHPIVLALSAGVLVLLAAMALPLWHMGRGEATGAAAGGGALPWEVAARADGYTEALGLRPGLDTLADVQARLGDVLQLALVARLGEVGTLEALVEPFSAGFVSGRLVLAFDVPADALRRWRDAASSSTPMDGGVRRFALHAEPLAEARSMRLAGRSFVPTLRLTGDDVRERFGPPAEQRRLADGALVLLYPQRGVSVAVQPGARAVLQYVAPRDFERRLRAPLQAGGG